MTSFTKDRVPIPLFRPTTGDEEAEAVRQVLKSGWIGNGPKAREFETEFAQYMGVKHAIALNSGTAALHLACEALRLGEMDTVVVPAITFCSTAHAPCYGGGRVIFCDIDPLTLNICPKALARIVENTVISAVIVVHFAGRPVDMDAIYSVIGDNVKVIEDCAHAPGAMYKGGAVGTLSDIGCYSFAAVKPLTTGDGGMLVTDNDAIAERVRRLAWCGIDKSTSERAEGDRYSWQYSVTELGWKFHMSDVAAAIGLVQLRKLDHGNQARAQAALHYREALLDIPEISLPPMSMSSIWHLYVIQAERRDELAEHLAECGITTGVHYEPLYRHSAYTFCPKPLPPARVAACMVFPLLLSLPMYVGFRDWAHVSHSIREFYA